MDLVNDERGRHVGDFNETSVVQINTRLTPSEGRNGTTRDFNEQPEGATSTQADGLLQVVMELKVRRFCLSRDSYRIAFKCY